ncbi:MAG: glycosyltransferase [Bacteroidia bacterium]|nr:glycosyltransferase [Bacteroidia bacterium]
MPKVLRIINRFNLGGITYNVSYLSRYLPENYHTLLIGGPQEKDEESSLYIPHSLGLHPTVLPELKRSINPLQDYLAYRRIKKIIREFKPDIVHTHASKAGFIGRFAAKHCGVPVIVHTFHGHVFEGYFIKPITRLIISVERRLARFCAAIVAISPEQKRQLSEVHRICEAQKIQVIPLGFDLRRFTENQAGKRRDFRERFGLSDDELALGIIGRLAPIKNHRLFIDAVLYASKHCSVKFKAFIIGDGKTREALETYIAERNHTALTGNHTTQLFTFTGWIKEADVALAGLDLVCLSSKNEGTPVSLIEAQAAGRYIVSTNVGGIKDILHPECGLLSEPGDDIGFQKNVLKAIQQFEQFQTNAGKAQKEVLEKFSYTRLCSDIEQLYEQLLKEKK